MGSNSELEALVQRAEDKCKNTFWSRLKGGPNYDDAADLLVEAANGYKLAHEWQRAAEIYERAAWASNLAENTPQQISNLIDSGHMLRKLGAKKAHPRYVEATKVMVAKGRLSQAGKLMKTLAEEYEQENDKSRAAACYAEAASYFELDEFAKSMHTECRVQHACLMASLEPDSLGPSIKVFEEEARKALKVPLLQFSAKEHWLKAGILHLASGDAVTASVACDEYQQMDDRFGSSRECLLLKELSKAIEEDNIENFTAAIANFDRVTKLDPWKVHFLHMAKSHLSGNNKVVMDSDEDGGGAMTVADHPAIEENQSGELDLT